MASPRDSRRAAGRSPATTADRPTAPEPSSPTTDAVERWKNTGMTIPGSQGEIAAFCAQNNGGDEE